jgi:hypothetical protein
MDAGRNETMKHSWRMKTAVLVFGFSNWGSYRKDVFKLLK